MRVVLTQPLTEKEYSDFESRKPCDFFVKSHKSLLQKHFQKLHGYIFLYDLQFMDFKEIFKA